MKPHELVKRLVDEAGGELPVAKAMGAPTFQGTLFKIGNGQVRQPKRDSAKRIADHFEIPIDAIYDEKLATAVANKRWPALGSTPAAPKTAESAPPPAAPASGFKEGVKLSDPEWEHIGWVRHLPKEDRDKLFADVKAIGEKWKQHTDEVIARYRNEGASAEGKPPKKR